MSGFVLPQPQPSSAGWSFSGYLDPAPVLASAKAAGGAAVATGPQLEPGVQWLIDRAVASCTSSTPTSLRLYDSQSSPAFLLDGTDSGNMDVTEYPAGLWLGQTRQLVAVWAGASANSVGTLRLQVRVYRYAGA